MIWLDLFIIQVHAYDKIQLNTYHGGKQQKQDKTRDSVVPGGFP